MCVRSLHCLCKDAATKACDHIVACCISHLIKTCATMATFFEWFCIVCRNSFLTRGRDRDGKVCEPRHRYHIKDAIHSIQRCVIGIFVYCCRCCCFHFTRVKYEIRDFFNTLMRIYLAFGFCFRKKEPEREREGREICTYTRITQSILQIKEHN